MESIIKKAVDALVQQAELKIGDMIVLGCSTSEIHGGDIGKASMPELGVQVADAFLQACRAHQVEPAFQCCEHLNRALVMEKNVLQKRGLVQVKAVPKPKAGGSVAAAAWLKLNEPALAQQVQADAAIDIGDTLVGMHIRPVAVPMRIQERKVGAANLVMAYSRLPLIGGERAEYE